MSETAVDETGTEEAGFAAMMAKAAEQAAGPAGEAPYGYTRDEGTGEVRPKKAAGRPRKSPPVDELKAAREAGDAPEARPDDRAPDARRRRARGTAEPGEKKPAPQFREGVIAKGVNKLYRKAGKMVRVADRDIGQALIDITAKDDDEDLTVGEAWEELARANPRIRAFLLRIIAGGAWGQLLMAHAPVLLAIMMKDAIRRRIPFGKLLEAFLTADEEQGGDGSAPADGTPFEGLTMPDMEKMMAMARQMAEQAAGTRAPGGTLRPPVPGPAATAAGPAASGS